MFLYYSSKYSERFLKLFWKKAPSSIHTVSFSLSLLYHCASSPSASERQSEKWREERIFKQIQIFLQKGFTVIIPIERLKHTAVVCTDLQNYLYINKLFDIKNAVAFLHFLELFSLVNWPHNARNTVLESQIWGVGPPEPCFGFKILPIFKV